MNSEKILQGILDIGKAMLESGAETARVEDSLYRMCKSYGFVRFDVFTIPSNLQATVEDPNGKIITQVRHIRHAGTHLDRLDYLNNLSRYVCSNTPDENEMRRRFLEVLNRKEQKTITRYIAGIMGGAGFAVFFGSGFEDAIVAVIVSILITGGGMWLSKRETSLMVYNFTLAFLSEIIIILSVRFGLGQHEGWITIGIVMLLISGLETTNGIRDILNEDILSGFLRIANSLIGATGIACGIALAMILLKGVI